MVDNIPLTLLPQPSLDFIAGLGSAAQELSTLTYLVGGSVRDIINNSLPTDLDFVVTGSLVELQEYLTVHWARLFPNTPPPIRTRQTEKPAMLKVYLQDELFPGCNHIDVVNTESQFLITRSADERYVSGSIESDLSRRDFTINAMALSILPETFGKLIDPFKGYNDLQSKRVQPVQPGIFTSDPTTILRAASFAARFQFILTSDCQSGMQEGMSKFVLENFLREYIWRSFRNLFLHASVPEAFLLLEGLKCVEGFVGCSFSFTAEHAQRLRKLYSLFASLDLPLMGIDGMSPYGIAALFSMSEEDKCKALFDFYKITSYDAQSHLQIRKLLIQKGIFE